MRRKSAIMTFGLILVLAFGLGFGFATWGSGRGVAQTATARALAASPALPALKLKLVAGGFDNPLYVVSPPGDRRRLFVVEKTGRIRIIKDGAVLPGSFLDLHTQVSSGSEQGLLSLAFDPHYATNRRFYVDFTNLAGDTRIVRCTASTTNPDRASSSSRRVLLAVHQPFANHNGGQLQFGPDGLLYIGMGDGGSGGDPLGNGQNSHSLLGKILRMNVNLAKPQATIYAKGLRNPWRFSFDRGNHNLWIGDVGQDKWEEIDVLRAGRPAGANLGWNGFEGTHVYNTSTASLLNKAKLVWPVAQYSHALGDAVTGGYVYRGKAIPGLRGFYLFADFGSGRVWAKYGPAGALRTVPGLSGKVVNPASFGQNTAGELYLVSLTTGRVYKIVPG